jgi:flagellar hook-basal body complex protein FliE
MSDLAISQVLAQMRELQSRIGGPGGIGSAPAGGLEGLQGPAQGPDFATLLKGQLDGVATLQNQAKVLADAYESGDRSVDITKVMLEVNKASIAFHAITEVRNKLVDAYTQVMNMSV